MEWVKGRISVFVGCGERKVGGVERDWDIDGEE